MTYMYVHLYQGTFLVPTTLKTVQEVNAVFQRRVY